MTGIPLRLQVFKNPFLRRLKSLKFIHPCLPLVFFFFLVQLQQNIDISVSFALFFSFCANYISCAVTIVSASCAFVTVFYDNVNFELLYCFT